MGTVQKNQTTSAVATDRDHVAVVQQAIEDAGILGDATAELLLRKIRRLTVQRLQRLGLIPLKPN